MRRRAYAHTGGTRRLEEISQESRISGLNPAFKMSMLMAGLIGVLISKSLGISLICLVVFTLCNIAISRLSFIAYFRIVAVPVSFLMLSSVVMLFDWSPVPMGTFDVAFLKGWLVVDSEGVARAAEVIVKALAATSLSYTIILSTSFIDIIPAMKTLRAPALIIELVVLMYRYITIIESALHQQILASETRLGGTSFKNSLRSLACVLRNVPFLSFHKTRAFYNAMEARLFNGEFRLLNERKPVFIAQALPVIFMSVLPFVLVFGRWVLR